MALGTFKTVQSGHLKLIRPSDAGYKTPNVLVLVAANLPVASGRL
jgi:hypothetical protein